MPLPTEEEFWQSIYAMQNGSFAGFRDWEEVPLEQWFLMLKIHNEAIEKSNREIEKARKRK